jgi:hypothetical protein
MTKAYIERNVALEIISDVIHDEKTYRKVRAIRRRMENTPAADVVEVVRCKDCVYSKNYNCTRGEMYDDTRYRPDYFCADGERREA